MTLERRKRKTKKVIKTLHCRKFMLYKLAHIYLEFLLEFVILNI